MDPYIEACGLWEDFHQKLMGDIEKALAATVPEHYVVRMGERQYVVLMSPEEAGIKEHMTQGDVSISFAPGRPPVGGGAVAVLAEPQTDRETQPVEIEALVEVEFREAFVEIHELEPKRRLVTTIEVLSPSNKRRDTAGWTRYLRKRLAHLEGGANLVEIDLLRGGTRMPMAEDWPESPYYLLVCRRGRGPKCTVWPAYYTRPLPEIPVPLAAPDPDVPLATQGMIDAIYQRSRYEVDIDYRQPCHPRLGDDGNVWLARRLQES
jgi:hypothetical protein